AEIPRVLLGQLLEPPRVLDRRRRIVDRAGAHDDHEPVVLTPEDASDLLARPGDGLRAPVAQRLLLEEDQRRQQRPEALDAQVTRALRHRAQMYTRAADVSMASVPVRVRTRRRRGRRDTLPDAVDRLAVLERIQKKVLWLGTYTVHHANSLRASSDGIKVGGHQASSSSWWATRSSTRATSVRRWPRKLSRG